MMATLDNKVGRAKSIRRLFIALVIATPMIFWIAELFN